MLYKGFRRRLCPGLTAVGLNSIRIHTSSRLLLRATLTSTSSQTELNLSTQADTIPRPLPRNPSQYDICPCLGGRFLPSNGRCYSCGRTRVDSLAKRKDSQFRSKPTYETERESLVEDTIRLLLEHRVIVIRAPPLSGKSTLLDFMGAKILTHHPKIEPVKIRWPEPSMKPTEKTEYWEILEEGLRRAIKANRTTSDGVNKKKVVYLIDDAHNTYLETDLWEDHFKRPSRSDPYFVLVCSYGAADRLFHRWGPLRSHAADILLDRRIELQQLLLNDQHMKEIIDAWAKTNSPDRPCGSDLLDFFQFYTNGHVGVLDSLLGALEDERVKGTLVSVTSRVTTNMTHRCSR